MKISEVIAKMKAYHKGTVNGVPIDESKTRDKVLYGNVDQECTGIVTTIYASVDVIREAIACGANLIICHEALFWNHGDHQEWLLEQGNKTFLAKKELLDSGNIVVWRDHDYIHTGIPMKDGSYVDGIFYGVAKMLGWEDYIVGDKEKPQTFVIPEKTAEEVGKEWISKFHLNGIKAIGDLQTKVRKVAIPFHIMGQFDNQVISRVDQEDIDCLICMELTDFTVTEYVRDSAMLNMPKAILAIGHFNVEEPGMEYMLTYLDEALGEHIPAKFVQATDMYQFIH
ncbi:MAG: Nif3-like dinuclear metal center hexameric protein [Erysipelotrichaceae bacterium]|nr:Nif3-like dinuclear metal center hexameric protein [Erysipelotrichaceae bacterium]